MLLARGEVSMAQTKLHELLRLGQSVWLDFIQRSFIQSGDLQDYVDQGVTGITSNPTIFGKAISEGSEYDKQMEALAQDGRSPQEIYEALTVEDARLAADVLRPVFDRSHGGDGFFSLEVNPHLADDRQATVNEAHRLFGAVAKPNVMIKIPATDTGYEAIRESTADGLNINITLIFSLGQYEHVLESYLSGLEKRVEYGYDVEHIASVASFFVSRVDTLVDELLDQHTDPAAKSLKGKIGIANAKMAYQRFKEVFTSERWAHLAEKGANVQRVLYGSTGTKNPEYSDVLYVNHLIGVDTINTIPPETMEAFKDHGVVALTLEQGLDEARAHLEELAKLGIDLEEVGRKLLDKGIEKFAKPYDEAIDVIAERSAELISH
jgi:transaldolase